MKITKITAKVSVLITLGICFSGVVISSLLSTGVFHAKAATSGFVSSQGDSFVLEGNEFYYSGTNQYYLTYKSNYMVNDVLDDAVNMNLKVIRIWGFIDAGTSNGDGTFTNNADGPGTKDGIYFQYWDPNTNSPAYNTGSDGLQKLDYVINAASQRNLRLIIALTNNWADFGGMTQYVKWAGLSNKDDFYTNSQIQGWYQNWISFLLNRQNSISGIQYKNDPAIFAWEMANEPRCSSDTSGDTIVNWARDTSAYIKSIDSNHMVSVGDEGFMDYEYQEAMDKFGTNHWAYTGTEGVDWNRLMELPDVDFGTVHLYPDHWGGDAAWGTNWIINHASENHQKPWILEEYGFQNKDTRDSVYSDWFEAIMDHDVDGDNFWILSGMQDDGTLYSDYDGFTVYYPSDTATLISNHAQAMNAKSGGDVPDPDTTPPAQVTGVSATGVSESQINLSWNANSESDLSKYSVYRGATSGFIPSSSSYIGQSYTNSYDDIGLSASTTYYYKVTAIDASGNEGLASSVASGTTTDHMIDNFESYGSNSELQSAWSRNTGGNSVTVSLSNQKYDGNYGMGYAYTVGNPGYAGVMKSINMDWSGSSGIEFWLDSDGSNRDLTIQFQESSGEYWETTFQLSDNSAKIVQLSYDSFSLPSWHGGVNGAVDLGAISQISIYIGLGNGGSGSGILYFDCIKPTVGDSPDPDTTPPSQVTGLSAEALSSSQITLNWNENGESDLSYYNIYRGTYSGFTPASSNLIGTASASHFSDSGLSAETTYYYRVSAVDTSSNEGSVSSQVSATTDEQSGDTTPPASPTGLSASALSISQIDLDWNDNGESDLAYYNVYRSLSPYFTASSAYLIGTSTLSDYSDSDLESSTTYYYMISAVDTSGNISPTSLQVSATTDDEDSGDYIPISAPFSYNGQGDLYWVTDTIPQSANSWGLQLLTINGVDYTNAYIHGENLSYSNLPPKINGHYYIHCISTNNWGHFHIS